MSEKPSAAPSSTSSPSRVARLFSRWRSFFVRTKNDDPAAKHEHPFRTPGKPTDEPLEGAQTDPALAEALPATLQALLERKRTSSK